MRDRDWLVPSAVLTLLSGLFGILMIPDTSGILPAVGILPLWIIIAALLGSMYGFLAMMMARVEEPIAHVRKFLFEERRTATVIALGIVLSGLNMTTFMWTKPLLNYLVAFWADPMLADLDAALFLGHDPWTLLTWLNNTPLAIFYHRGWFAMMIVTLLVVLAAKPSPEKSAVMLSYFLLWSVIGPIIHTLLPAAGPVFYAQMGYGDRFAALQNVTETREVATYLWTIYSGEGFGPGSGISAMPSLHIATVGWMILAVRIFAPRWTWVMAGAGFLIFLLSISLGWHYALDGIVGAAAAWACYRACGAFYSRRPGLDRAPAVAG